METEALRVTVEVLTDWKKMPPEDVDTDDEAGLWDEAELEDAAGVPVSVVAVEVM